VLVAGPARRKPNAGCTHELAAAGSLAGGARFDASPGIWNHVRMTTLFLVARLHVDLQRVSSAVCRDAG